MLEYLGQARDRSIDWCVEVCVEDHEQTSESCGAQPRCAFADWDGGESEWEIVVYLDVWVECGDACE